MLPGEARAAASSFSLEISTTRRQRALAALDLDAIQDAVIKSFATGSPPVTVTAEQMTLEDLGDSRVRVTIVQAEGGPAAEAITASAKQPTFLESVATELSVPKVYYDTAPVTISVTVAPPPPPPPVPLSQVAEVNLVSDGRSRPWIVGVSVAVAVLVVALVLLALCLARRYAAAKARGRDDASTCPPSPSVEGGLPSTSTEAEPSAPPLERSASWGRVGIKRSNSVKRPTHADPDSAAGPSGASALTFRI